MIKLIVLGDTNVGKTNTVNRYVSNKIPNIVTSTIGVEFFTKQLRYNDNNYSIYIWDTAGQERFRSIITTYFRNHDCAVIFFDLTKYESFINLEDWLIELRNKSDMNSPVFVIGNKLDLVSKVNEQIPFSQMDNLQEKYPEIIDFKFISALTGENINEALDDIVKKTIDRIPDIKNRDQYVELNPRKKKRTCSCN